MLFNRIDCCGERTKNVQVRISDELPSSASEMFTGGTTFGWFEGPATDGQHIVITADLPAGQEAAGRYVVVQMNNGADTQLNLIEVKVFGDRGNVMLITMS